ncbi:SseB family protein [Lentzea sp. CA-135723]|uniref:SseB family protein n=1 Tax=Lentzea sp. CA-135723 TaxID=3239950 RepID=UPI003D93B000
MTTTEPAVVHEAEAYYQGTGDAHRMLAAFRATALYVCRELDPPAVPTIEVPSAGRWLQVFTTTARLTSVVGAEHTYMRLLGSEVLDLLLPLLPEGLGVIMDPHTSHMITWPPVPPIVNAWVLQLPGIRT